MSKFRHQVPTFMRIALLLLLLSMQSFTSAHELNQGTTHDSSLCTSCSIGNGHDGAIPVHQPCPVLIENFILPTASSHNKPAATLRQIPEARAPPSFL